MRINKYKFPDGTPENIMLLEGCGVILKDGHEIFVHEIPNDKRNLVDFVNPVIEGIRVTTAKRLLKTYGGRAWTEHYERDGGCFEITEIYLEGNNSRFIYNHHL